MNIYPVVSPAFGGPLKAVALLVGLGCVPLGAIECPAHAEAAPACASPQPGEPMLVTAECRDPDYNAETFIVDKVSEVAGAFPHTRVDAHFRAAPDKPQFRVTIQLPVAGKWQGRFFQHVYPLEQPENEGDLAFSLSNGGYLVNVKGVACGCGGYRPDAAAAKLAKAYARKFYGSDKPIHGYVWGGSGGGLVTIGAVENTAGVWDGAVPYVMPNSGSLLNINAVGALAHLVLADRLPAIADAVAPGSRTDPKATLTAEQKAIYDEVLALGVPQRSFEGAAGDPSGGGALLMFLSGGVQSEDPSYVADFWSKAGYEGVDAPDYLKAAKRDEMAVISRIVRNAKGEISSVVLDHAPDLGKLGPLGPVPFEYWLYGPDGKTRLGQLAGSISGDTITLQGPPTPATPGQLGAGLEKLGAQTVSDGLAGIAPGYKVRVNNLFNLALHFYHRHALPLERDMYAYNYLRGPDGAPRYPQRSFLASSAQAVGTAGGGTQTGRIRAKVIVNQSMLDGGAAPWMADWYARRVRSALGAKRFDENFRIYLNDNAVHMDIPPGGNDGARIVSYVPALYRSLLDLVAWVEDGVAPAASTRYTVDGGQLHLAAGADNRRGIQPVVDLSVNGTDRVEVAVNQSVSFKGRVQVPNGAGRVASTAWWFGDTPFSLAPVPVSRPADGLDVVAQHRFSKPGTYFVTLWATSVRDGDASGSTQLQNLDRVRVIVK